jgi:glycosidase
MFPNPFTPKTHKLIIYQALVRLFGNTRTRNKPYGTINENGCGKMGDFSDKALVALRDFGVTHIWYTGILEHSSTTDYSDYSIKGDDPRIVKGRAGSPYAIRDYYDVCPDLALDPANRMDEFGDLIARTHTHGLKAIIDFVPNHVARSYHSDQNPGRVADLGALDDMTVLFARDNNFLYLKNETFNPPADYRPLGGIRLPSSVTRYSEFPARVTGNDVYSADPSLNDWFETVKLNFGIDPVPPHKCHFDPVPATWTQLLDILLYWCEKGVDGFRCDMAEMVPAEFWEWVIPCVKTRFPEVIFIAEIYKRDQFQLYLEKGFFDYIYDKVCLYDTLSAVLRGDCPADNITASARSVEKYSEKMLSFMENHDEQRLASAHFTDDPFAALPAVSVCASISKGPFMIYFGQEMGEPALGVQGFSGDDGRTSIFDYCAVPEFQKWFNRGRCDGAQMSNEQRQLYDSYKSLIAVCRSSEAIREGGFYDLQYLNRHYLSEGFDERFIYAFIRHTTDEQVLIVVNFSRDREFDTRIKISDEVIRHTGIKRRDVYRLRNLTDVPLQLEVGYEDWTRSGDRMSGLRISLKPLCTYILQIS